jgi:hypothetical protein
MGPSIELPQPAPLLLLSQQNRINWDSFLLFASASLRPNLLVSTASQSADLVSSLWLHLLVVCGDVELVVLDCLPRKADGAR